MTSYTYECAPDVKWVVETRGILIAHPDRGAYCSLPYPAAAVWDFLSRGYGARKISEMIKYIGGFEAATEAELYVTECLETWISAGLVRRVEGGSWDV